MKGGNQRGLTGRGGGQQPSAGDTALRTPHDLPSTRDGPLPPTDPLTSTSAPVVPPSTGRVFRAAASGPRFQRARASTMDRPSPT